MRRLWADPEWRVKHAEAQRRSWGNSVRRERASDNIAHLNTNPEFARKRSEERSARMKRLHADPEFAAKAKERSKRTIARLRLDPSFDRAASERMKRLWEDSAFRKKVSDGVSRAMKIRHKDPAFRRKLGKSLLRRPSGPETVWLAYVASDSDIHCGFESQAVIDGIPGPRDGLYAGRRVILELDGPGGHGPWREAQAERDARTNALAVSLGYRIIRDSDPFVLYAKQRWAILGRVST